MSEHTNKEKLRQILQIVAAVGLLGMLASAVLYCATLKYLWLFFVFIALFFGGIIAMGKLAPRRPRQPKNPYQKRRPK